MHCYAKYSPPAFKGRPSHGFIAYLLTLLTISGTSLKLRGTVLVLCSTQAEYQHPPEHKNERQRILEGICETIWPSRTSNRGCSMDAVLQIFKRSICPGTPFFESLAKKPPTTMDDLFRRANKYSMLEDDVRAATQQVLVAGRASRDTRTDMPNLRTGQNQLTGEDGPSRPDRPPITPLSVSYEKLLPMIQGLSDFRWPRPLETDPSMRDRSKKCAFHKDHGHTTETCRSLQYLVERLIKAGHLKQYLRSDTGGRDVSQHHNSGAPRAPVAPKAVINYINGAHLTRNTIPGGKGRNCCEPRQYANALIPSAGFSLERALAP
ncbi:hypothetical protein CK203_042437 [Vitis vinifera]|uniref:Retrotransposon gag domain-containing protein n=1 Tax=Vitis vinifera TaxID=29760 RepID=A0A438HET0_VITVI|nr:hypothetical protein CK203_042437 [Vitis vinifera]